MQVVEVRVLSRAPSPYSIPSRAGVIARVLSFIHSAPSTLKAADWRQLRDTERGTKMAIE
jgi:hypothetical protein